MEQITDDFLDRVKAIIKIKPNKGDFITFAGVSKSGNNVMIKLVIKDIEKYKSKEKKILKEIKELLLKSENQDHLLFSGQEFFLKVDIDKNHSNNIENKYIIKSQTGFYVGDISEVINKKIIEKEYNTIGGKYEIEGKEFVYLKIHNTDKKIFKSSNLNKIFSVKSSFLGVIPLELITDEDYEKAEKAGFIYKKNKSKAVLIENDGMFTFMFRNQFGEVDYQFSINTK